MDRQAGDMIYSVGQQGSTATMPTVPDYQRVADNIRAQIADGRLAPGSRLPSNRALAETYGVSMGTVNQAMIVLKTAGVVVGHQGKGVFVAPTTAETSG